MQIVPNRGAICFFYAFSSQLLLLLLCPERDGRHGKDAKNPNGKAVFGGAVLHKVKTLQRTMAAQRQRTECLIYKYNKVYGRNAMWFSSDKESLMCWKQQIIIITYL